MAVPILTVEDGSGVPDANTYGTQSQITDYLNDHYLPQDNAWANLDVDSQKYYIVSSAQTFDIKYGVNVSGTKLTSDQGLEMPHTAFIDKNGFSVSGIFPAIIDSQSELCMLLARGIDLYPLESSGDDVISFTDKIGDLEESVTYENGVSIEQTILRRVNAIMAQYTSIGSNYVYRI